MMIGSAVWNRRPLGISSRRVQAQVAVPGGKGQKVSKRKPRRLAQATDVSVVEELRAQIEALRLENEALRGRITVTEGQLDVRASPPDVSESPPAVPTGEARAAEAAPASPAPSTEGASQEPAPVVAFAEDQRETLQALEQGIAWPRGGEEFWKQPPRHEEMLLEDNSPSRFRARPPPPQPLHIVHLTAEMAPIAKVGGLGDVITGLSKATAQLGHAVQVMMPYYSCLPPAELVGLTKVAEFDCPSGRVWDGAVQAFTVRTAVHSAAIDGVAVLLVAPLDRAASNLFNCDRIYGGSYNETAAYLYFCRACLEYLAVTGSQPDILHLHEWQCSAAAMLYWELYSGKRLEGQRLVLTIHNLDNPGECSQDEFSATGTSGKAFATIDKALDERTIGHNPERLCLMKGGIVYSNAVSTVSPTYAREAREGGAAGFLRTILGEPHVSAKFSGVLNGIDTDAWCPSRDALLPAAFNSALPQGKALCKRFLQQGLGLDVDPAKPLVACITRLVPQKGIHLIRHSVHRTHEQGGQFVLLGTGHADADFRGMASGQFRDSKDVRLLLMYSEPLAHQIYAAADFVIVPSLFEPCGLTQLIACRYGALPIVRKTGGLADTVQDLASSDGGNGFVFEGADEAACSAALDRAFALFRDQARFAEVSARNMDIDSSWSTPASTYLDMYQKALEK